MMSISSSERSEIVNKITANIAEQCELRDQIDAHLAEIEKLKLLVATHEKKSETLSAQLKVLYNTCFPSSGDANAVLLAPAFTKAPEAANEWAKIASKTAETPAQTTQAAPITTRPGVLVLAPQAKRCDMDLTRAKRSDGTYVIPRTAGSRPRRKLCGANVPVDSEFTFCDRCFEEYVPQFGVNNRK